jgi:hypothetical protein
VVLTTDFGADSGRESRRRAVITGCIVIRRCWRVPGFEAGRYTGHRMRGAAWPVDGAVRPADICATIYRSAGDGSGLVCVRPAEQAAQGGAGWRAPIPVLILE